MSRRRFALLVALAGTSLSSSWAHASPSSFTYQGRLDVQGEAYSGSADYRFTLFNAPVDGESSPDVVLASGVEVEDGLFTAALDFGTDLLGRPLWIQVEVRTPAWDGIGAEPAFTVFPERIQLTGSPYSLATRGLKVNADGSRVGIGTENPESMLHLDSDGPVVLTLDSGFSSLQPALIDFRDFGDSRWTLGKDAFNAFSIGKPGQQPAVKLAALNGNMGLRGEPLADRTLTVHGNLEVRGGFAEVHLGDSTDDNTYVYGTLWAQQNLRVVQNSFFQNDAYFSRYAFVGAEQASAPAGRFNILHPSAEYGLVMRNNDQGTFHTGMRVSPEGFFDITNRVQSPAGFARLISSGVWTVLSDERSKEDMHPIDGMLEKAMRLDPIGYRYIGGEKDGPERIGFTAQNVAAEFPSLVAEGSDYMTLDYSGLSTVAIGALQELKAEKDRELAELRALVESMAAELAELRRGRE